MSPVNDFTAFSRGGFPRFCFTYVLLSVSRMEIPKKRARNLNIIGDRLTDSKMQVKQKRGNPPLEKAVKSFSGDIREISIQWISRKELFLDPMKLITFFIR